MNVPDVQVSQRMLLLAGTEVLKHVYYVVLRRGGHHDVRRLSRAMMRAAVWAQLSGTHIITSSKKVWRQRFLLGSSISSPQSPFTFYPSYQKNHRQPQQDSVPPINFVPISSTELSKHSEKNTMSSLRSLQTLLRAPVRAATTTCPRQPSRSLPQSSIIQKAVGAYHTSRRLQLPYKDDQDRESLKPRSTEGTKSSSDDDAAAQTDTAFDPSTTRPEAEKESARRESKQKDGPSPLESSGADQGTSQPLGRKGGSEMNQTIKSDRNKASGAGSPEKRGKGPAA